MFLADFKFATLLCPKQKVVNLEILTLFSSGQNVSGKDVLVEFNYVGSVDSCIWKQLVDWVRFLDAFWWSMVGLKFSNFSKELHSK